MTELDESVNALEYKKFNKVDKRITEIFNRLTSDKVTKSIVNESGYLSIPTCGPISFKEEFTKLFGILARKEMSCGAEYVQSVMNNNDVANALSRDLEKQGYDVNYSVRQYHESEDELAAHIFRNIILAGSTTIPLWSSLFTPLGWIVGGAAVVFTGLVRAGTMQNEEKICINRKPRIVKKKKSIRHRLRLPLMSISHY